MGSVRKGGFEFWRRMPSPVLVLEMNCPTFRRLRLHAPRQLVSELVSASAMSRAAGPRLSRAQVFGRSSRSSMPLLTSEDVQRQASCCIRAESIRLGAASAKASILEESSANPHLRCRGTGSIPKYPVGGLHCAAHVRSNSEPDRRRQVHVFDAVWTTTSEAYHHTNLRSSCAIYCRGVSASNSR